MTIKLKGREIPLVYTVLEMKTVQEEICSIGDFQYVFLGQNKEDEKDMSKFGSPEHLDAIAKLIRILGNAGLEENGEAPELTDRKVMRAMNPAMLAEYVNICMDAIAEGMKSEIPEEKKEGPVDVTLEEMNKKKEKES